MTSESAENLEQKLSEAFSLISSLDSRLSAALTHAAEQTALVALLDSRVASLDSRLSASLVHAAEQTTAVFGASVSSGNPGRADAANQ